MLHYVPHHSFLMYKKDLDWTANNARMGSIRYHELAKEYKVSKVIFGHTHYTMNKEIEGIQYCCNPVGYSGRDFQGSLEKRVLEQLRVFDV